MQLKPLSKQTMVITGGSSGIGLATAQLAGERGANVVIVARGEDGLSKAAQSIRDAGGRCDTIVADVGVRADVKRVVDTVIDRHGGFDSWVSNAGVGAYALLEELSDEDHEHIFQTNYWGVVYCATEALRHLKKRGGALITTGSIASQMPAPVLSAYTASKFAVKGYIDSLRLELMHQDAPVSVTLIQPSGIHTPFAEHATNQMEGRAKVPPPAYAPELVAQAVCRAAEHPTRDVIVGGAGRAMTLLATVAPGLADRLFAKAFFVTAREENKPKRGAKGGFQTAGGAGELYGDQEDPMRRTSVYTTARTHPVATASAAVAAAAAAGAIALVLRSRDQPASSGGSN